MIKNNVYTVNPVMARALSNRSTQVSATTPVSNMSVTEKAVLSSVQANLEPNQLAYSFVNVDGTSLAADTSTSTLSVTYESPLNVSISGSSLLFKLIQNETQMFVSKAQVEEWTAKADGDHKHSGNDITTGTIPPEVLNNIPINKITGLENELNYLRNVTLNSYTKSEMDVKLLDIQSSFASTLEDMIGDLDNPIWKNPVGTLADLATAYPTPDPGWVVTTIDTSIVYLYTGTQWLPISANSIPLATQTTAGLMSVDDKIRLDELISGGGSDGAATTLGGFTQDYFLNRSSNAQEKTGDLTVANMYSKGAVVAHMTSNYSGITEPIAGTNILGFVKVDGTTITIDLDGTIHSVGSGAGSWNELSDKPANLTALAALTGAGIVRRNSDGSFVLDTATYLLSSAYTAADVLAKMLTVDGIGSGLDADLLDGQHSSFYFNRNTLFNDNNVDYNAVNYEIGHGVTTQPIHLPNYTGAVNAPFSSYGQMIHFDGNSFFPFRIAFDYAGRMFFQGAGYKPNGPYNYSSGTPWLEFFHSGNSNKKTVDWNAKDLKCVNTFADGAVVAHMTSDYSGITEPIAGTNVLGFVKVDGTTITIDLDGTIHSVGSGAGSWSELSGKPADLVAIAALAGTSGLLKKTGVGTWELDTNTYLQSSALNNYLALGGGIMTGTITKTASNTIPAFLYKSPTNSSLGAFTIYDSTNSESLAFATLSDMSTFKFICGTAGYVPPTVTISQFSPSFEITKDSAKVLGNVVWHAGNFNAATFNAASATYASAVTLTADNGTNATNYVLFANAAIGNLSPRTDTAFSYNPSTNILTAGSFAGNFTGGTVSGTAGTFSSDLTVSGSLRGNAGLELYHATPFIDFHYGNSTADYTSRIIENASGTLSIQANANVTGNMIASGLVVAHSTGSWTNTLPIASSSILGTIIAGTSLNVTGAGVLDLKIDHYTTTSGYTSRVSKVRTFEMSLNAGTLGANAVELYSLTNYPSSTVYALTATFVAYTSDTVGVPIIASVRKGSSNWELLLYNSSSSAITKTSNMKVNLIGLMTV